MDVATCECAHLEDPAVIDMGHHEEVFRTLDEIGRRGWPWWWLLSFRCGACGQDWLVASEERQNDVFILRRLDRPTAERIVRENVWPPDLERYETLLEIGKAAGRSVRFLNVADSSLPHTIADLAKERPGIRVSELASLLNLDPAVAHELARRVASGSSCHCFVCNSAPIVEPGSVTITFDSE